MKFFNTTTAKLFLLSLSIVFNSLLWSIGCSQDYNTYGPNGVRPHTIKSSLKMEIWATINGEDKKLGNTPGVVKIPRCQHRTFYLTGLNLENASDYKKTIDHYQIEQIRLPKNITNQQLEKYCDKGLFKNLTVLYLVECKKLTHLPELAGNTKLAAIHLYKCENLDNLSGLADLTELRHLDLYGNKKLTSLFGLTGLVNLQMLDVTDYEKLSDLSGIKELKNLRSFSLVGPNSVDDFSPLSHLKNLTIINLTISKNLTDLSWASGLAGLEILNIQGCQNLANLSYLSSLKNLRMVVLTNCPQLKASDIQQLQKHLPNCEIIKN